MGRRRPAGRDADGGGGPEDSSTGEGVAGGMATKGAAATRGRRGACGAILGAGDREAAPEEATGGDAVAGLAGGSGPNAIIGRVETGVGRIKECLASAAVTSGLDDSPQSLRGASFVRRWWREEPEEVRRGEGALPSSLAGLSRS